MLLMVTECLAISTPTSYISPSELCNLIGGMVFYLKEMAGWGLTEVVQSLHQGEEKGKNRPLPISCFLKKYFSVDSKTCHHTFSPLFSSPDTTHLPPKSSLLSY
jgi:hypothetical protein